MSPVSLGAASAKCGWLILCPSYVDYNQAGGWADSRQAVVDVLARVRARGVQFASGEVAELLLAEDGRDVKGVKTAEGLEYRANFVVLAAGAWTGKLVPEIAHDLLATGQTVATIQLSSEDAAEYRNVPVSCKAS